MNSAGIFILSLTSILGLWQASLASIGPLFLFYLAPGLVALGMIPFLAYRLYALQNASYTVERDGIRLRWGLRLEDIPMTEIEWVYPAAELTMHPPLPRLYWPGAILGMRHIPGGGEIEYLAAQAENLLIIATSKRYYAISPMDAEGFLLSFQRFTEMGSLTPLAGRSVYPTIVFSQIWASPPARILLLAGAGLSLILLVSVSLVIPGREQIRLGFQPDGQPGDYAPAVRLFLLPVVNTFFFTADLVLGTFLFRRTEKRAFAYILWGSGALAPLLFLLAVMFLLRSG